jgi:tetratricopeptide (TPR) repeat protein
MDDAIDDDGLTELSNSAVDLANAGRLDEALAACARLLAEFPEVVDGLERSAMVHAKLGHHALAADLYRQAFEFVTDPSRKDDYEDQDYYREQAEKQQRLADSL